MKRIILICGIVVFFCIPQLVQSALNPVSPFDVAWDEEPISAQPGKPFKAIVTIQVPPDHFIYADKTELDFTSLEGIRINDISYPKPISREDPYFGRTMDVFEGNVVITISGHIPETLKMGEHDLVARLIFQGCSEKLCLREQEREVVFRVNVESLKKEAVDVENVAPAVIVEPAKELSGVRALLKSDNFNEVLSQGVPISVLVVFIGGILVSLTPCLWPIIPIILLIIGVEAQKKWWKNILVAGTFVLGLVIINSSLGILAVALGKSIGFLFQQKIFLLLVVLFFIAMSLSMFGLFEFHPLKPIQRYLHKLGGKGFLGAFLMGLLTGLIASPCASPVLAALLGYVALKQSYVTGLLLLVVFGLGMGLVFIVFGSAYGVLAGKFKGGKWTIWVKRVLAVILLIPAVFYLRSLVRWNGVYHPGLDTEVPRVEWVTSREEGLKFSKKSNRPIMIEFYADWCPPCRSLESKFFRQDDIVKLSYQLVPVRIDATVSSPEVEEAISEFNVIGWPAFYFLSPKGQIYDDLTVISYDPKKIEASMRAAVEKVKGNK